MEGCCITEGPYPVTQELDFNLHAKPSERKGFVVVVVVFQRFYF